MRTTVDIRDDLMESLLARHPGASKREAIELAIESYVSKDVAAAVKELVGRIEIEDVSRELRALDRQT